MHSKQFEIIINQQKYDVFVIYKYQRNMYFRLKNNAFYVTCPSFTLKSQILKGVEKFGPRLLQKTKKEFKKHYSFNEHFIYLFGEKLNLEIADNFKIEKNTVFCKDDGELQKNLRKLLVNYLNKSVRNYEVLMSIKKPYQISVKSMKSRYGSNSMKTHRLHFQSDLVHFSFPIIDSVIVHELAHEFYRNHQSEFYSCVLEYCPDYYNLKKKLRNKVYS